MDAQGWFILVAIISSIAVFIFIFRAKKRKKTEELVSTEDETSDDAWLESLEDFLNDLEENPKQITIYAFNSSAQKCLCPLCDGENEVSAIYCHICGQKLRRGGE